MRFSFLVCGGLLAPALPGTSEAQTLTVAGDDGTHSCSWLFVDRSISSLCPRH